MKDIKEKIADFLSKDKQQLNEAAINSKGAAEIKNAFEKNFNLEYFLEDLDYDKVLGKDYSDEKFDKFIDNIHDSIDDILSDAASAMVKKIKQFKI